MTRPGKVVAFLDVAGDWDPSLAFVMVGAIAVHSLSYRMVVKRPRPLLGGSFAEVVRAGLDLRLFVGAALFGVGWGLVGYCPGPAVTALGALRGPAVWFVPSMLAGMALHRIFMRPRA